MGNCQAVDTTRIVIQHPNGKEEMLSCPVSASYVMKMNLGHCVALLISTTALSASPGHGGPLRLTRIKLLRPTETLVLGHVYRLITTKEVMKGLMAKKCSKSKKEGKMSEDKVEMVKAFSSNKLDNEDQLSMAADEKARERKTTKNLKIMAAFS
ncbi:uncharacterized protein BNAC03G27640D isoform X2 [Brassica napus]|uniref:uncharacterized protein BNAC03G27640D isoform X2 n=1 Tax=Brassica napus TaxID=3708 RepID=UPI000BBF338F|nr:uncharacterized protein BNAC03G27640D isoform X2 [Brassica napus]